MNRHQGNCRINDVHHKMLKIHGGYYCRCCKAQYGTKNSLKNHIFMTHSKPEVKAKYQKSIEQLMGGFMLEKLRRPLLKKLVASELIQFVLMLICSDSTINNIKIEYGLPINLDTDPVNQARRIKLYYKLKQMLLRIVPEAAKVPKTARIGRTRLFRIRRLFLQKWHLMKRLSDEQILREVLQQY